MNVQLLTFDGGPLSAGVRAALDDGAPVGYLAGVDCRWCAFGEGRVIWAKS